MEEGDDVDEWDCRRNAGDMPEKQKRRTRGGLCFVCGKKGDEDVCGKKEGNGGMGSLGNFGVCGKN